MSGLAAVLAGRTPPGVYRWHSAFTAEDAARTVEDAGWRFGHVDGWGPESESEAEFHRQIAVTFDFPDWYGGNLDALFDCLINVTEPAVLLWDGWGPLAWAEPERFPKLLRVLHDRTAEFTPMAVLLRGDGPTLEVASLV